MDYIIDGYNLIFQCGLQTRQATDDMLCKARNRMIREICAGVAPAVAKRITVVFDAANRLLLAQGNSETIGGLKILFADQYDDADTLIEHLIAGHATPRKLTVVSSDHRLHKAALRRNALPIDSDIWFDRLTSGKMKHSPEDLQQKRRQQESSFKEGASELATVDWQTELGVDEVDVAKIQAQIARESQSPLSDAPIADQLQRVEEGFEAEPDIDGTFNPFPPGYGEDLLDD